LNLGEAEQARTAFREALALSNESGDRKMQTLTYRSLGNFYSKVGQPQQALAALRKALEIVEQGEGQLLKARVVAGIGHTYLQLRDFEKALTYDTKAVNMFQRLGNKWGEAELRMDLGEIHYYRNERDEALTSYNLALPLFRELGMTRFRAQTLSSIGVVYASRGDYEKALDYYKQSLRLTRSGQDQRYDAYTLNYLGELQLAMKKQTEAAQNFRDALALNQEASDPVGEVMTLYNLARLARDTGSLGKATDYSEQALKIIESVRMAVAGEKLRANFAASVHQHYELRVDILKRQDQQVAALEVSERGRARSWLESLGEAGAEIREGVDQAILDRADALQKKIDAKSQEQIRLMTRAHTDKEEQDLAQELRKLASDYEELDEEIRANSQRYARLPQASALTGPQIQQQVDNDSVFLEFSLGDDRSYVWVISPEWIKGVELPSRKVIEPVCRRLYESLAARSRRTAGPMPAGYAATDAEAERSAKELGQILFKPIHDLLGHKRLLIVPDGELQYVPFEVLAEASDQASSQPLVANHEIVYLPSASVIAEQRAKFKNRPLAPKTIVIFADPVFEDTDERVEKRATRKNTRPRQGSSAGRVASSTTRSTGDSESTNALRAAGFVEGIPRLPYSNQEARRIMSLVPQGQGVAELGFDANRTAATSVELAKYRYIHFATHGLLNSEHPELSGILLSMVNASGSSQNGFLQLHEIYKMQLPVELVVLSACQTALGKEVRGEGLFGLTRGFMYVGAKRTVSTLWKVDDSATAELMELFYKEMLQNGSTPAAALQTAKNKLRKQKPWQAPFFWAGFIIQGDWR
jgi:CHAT domain-containing protein